MSCNLSFSSACACESSRFFGGWNQKSWIPELRSRMTSLLISLNLNFAVILKPQAWESSRFWGGWNQKSWIPKNFVFEDDVHPLPQGVGTFLNYFLKPTFCVHFFYVNIYKAEDINERNYYVKSRNCGTSKRR